MKIGEGNEKKRDHKVNEGHCGIMISKVKAVYVLFLLGVTVFCFLGKTLHSQCIILPRCTNGYCQIKCLRGVGGLTPQWTMPSHVVMVCL